MLVTLYGPELEGQPRYAPSVPSYAITACPNRRLIAPGSVKKQCCKRCDGAVAVLRFLAPEC
jgi:hypothetical protein